MLPHTYLGFIFVTYLITSLDRTYFPFNASLVINVL